MKTDEIKKELVQLGLELFKNMGYDDDQFEYVDLIDDIGMDSVTFIALVVEIESKFDIVIPNEMLLMENFRKISDIINVIEKEIK